MKLNPRDILQSAYKYLQCDTFHTHAPHWNCDCGPCETATAIESYLQITWDGNLARHPNDAYHGEDAT